MAAFWKGEAAESGSRFRYYFSTALLKFAGGMALGVDFARYQMRR